MKRKNLLFVLLLAFFAPWAANAQQPIPYSEGFEYMSSADDLTAADWISSMSSTSSFLAIETSSSNVNTGSKALNIDSWNAASTDHVIVGLPIVEAAINTLQITFSYKVTNTTVAVGYLTDANDASTFVSLESFGGSSSYTTKTVELSTAPATAARIAIKYTGYYRCYIDDILVKPLPTCIKPTLANVNTETIEANQASVQWTENGSATSWVLEYSTSNNFANATSLTQSGIPAKIIDGLNPATIYYVRVKASCGGGEESDWSNTVSFTTLFGIPFVEEFATTSAPTGWTRSNTLLTDDVLNGTTTINTYSGGWSFGTGNNVFDSHAKANIYGTTAKYWLITPTVPMENNVQLSFDVALTKYSGNNLAVDPTQQLDDRFVVLITTDGGTTWTILRQWDNAGSEYVYNNISPASIGQTVTINLSSYAGRNIAVAFYGESTQAGGDNNLHIDNVIIDYIPSCLKPTDLAVTDITDNSAELSWTANSGESAWKLYWKKASDENYTEELTGVTNPYILGNLDANTDYIFYVVANCGGSDGVSEPSNTYTFTTQCEAASIPYTYGFEDADLFDCWKPIAGVAIQYGSGNSHEGSHSLKFSGTTNNIVALPLFEDATNTLRLEFWTRPESNTNSSCGNFDVGYMTDISDASSFVAVATYAYNDWEANEFVKKTVDFDNAPANACIAMRQYNNATSWYWFVDDVTVKEIPSCLAPTGLAVVENSVTAHEAVLTWDAEEGATFQWNIGGEWTDTQDNTVELTGLTDNEDYTFTLRKKCSDTDFSEELTTSFTTLEACPTPTGFAMAENGLAGSFATLEWTGSSDSYTVSYRTKAYMDGINEGFGTSIPSGWTQYTGLLSDVMEGTTTLSSGSQWSFGTGNGVFDAHAKINIYGSGSYSERKGWLVTPEITVPAGAVFSFDMALTAYSGTVAAPGTTGTDDRFIVLISTDDMETWTILREWNNNGSEYVYNDIANTATGENVSIDITDYVGQSVYIAFYGESTVSNADNNLHLDNVIIGVPVAAGEWQTVTVEETTATLTGLTPETLYEAKVQGDCGEEGLSNETELITFTTLESCPAPTGLAINYTGGTTAEVTWVGTAETYNLQVGEVVIEGIEYPYTLEELELATTYEVKVQANCENDETSEWTEIVSFTTDMCMPENQCEIIFELTDSYGDGWNGAYIEVLDVATGSSLAQMTNQNLNGITGDGTNEFNILSLAVCDGREIQFVWHGGNYDGECSYIVTDIMGEEIFYGSGAMSEPVNYTVNCPPTFTKQILGYGNIDNPGGYYLIASPIGYVNPEHVGQMTGTPFDLYRFNQENEVEWENYKTECFDLEPGKGYLYANMEDVTLTFVGYPMQSGGIEPIPLQRTEGVDWAGWNLVGNPFAETAYILDINGETVSFYTLNSDGSKLEPVESFASIEPMEGVFVYAEQDDEVLNFTTEEPEKGSMLVLNMSNENGYVDRVMVCFDGSRQLPKFMLNENDTKMYFPMSGNEYAVVRGDKSGTLPVNFEPAEDGIYTISVNIENVAVRYLHLIDHVENVDIDLLSNPSYSFKANAYDMRKRFELVFRTGSNLFKELVSRGGDSEDFSFCSNGNWIIDNEGEAILQVIDVNGQVLSSERISGCVSKRIDAVPGLYLLRLVNGDNVKVQKIVVQ